MIKVIKTINLIGLNEQNSQICLVKRASENKNKEKWAFIGESIKDGESNNKAIIRILNDNMNCKVTNIKEIKKSETRTKTTIIKSQYVVGNISGDIKVDMRKIGEYKWFNIDEKLLNLDYAFNQKMILEKYLELITS